MSDEIRIALDPGMSQDLLAAIWEQMIADVKARKVVIFSMSPGTYRLPDNWKLNGSNSPVTFGVGGKGRELMFSYRAGRRLFVDTRLIGQTYTWRPLFG